MIPKINLKSDLAKYLQLGLDEACFLAVPFGVPEIDKCTKGGIRLGAVHEVVGTAADSWLMICLKKLNRVFIWLSIDSVLYDQPVFPPAIFESFHSCFIQVNHANREVLLSLAFELLKKGYNLVIELDQKVDFLLSRKLSLAVHKSGVVCFVRSFFTDGLADPADYNLFECAASCWRVSSRDTNKWPDYRRLAVELSRNKGGRKGEWLLDWSCKENSISLVSGPVGKSI